MADAYSPQRQELLLPPAVEQLITNICMDQNVAPLGQSARQHLASVGEDLALGILRAVASSQIRTTFDRFVTFLINKKTAGNNGSPTRRLCMSPSSPQSPTQPSRSTSHITPTRLTMPEHCDTNFSPPIPMDVQNGSGSPQLNALGELEFRKAFLMLSYIGGKKLEEVISVDAIQGLKNLSMDKFEAEVWKLVGYIDENDRRKSLSWDSGRTHNYHCHVNPDGSCRFKGPYLSTKSNFLQRALGDRNVLLVKIAEEGTCSASNFSDYHATYGRLAKDGILVGLRRYRFFVFKDGGKEEKKKDPTTSPVKCYFVCVESRASNDNSDYILFGKTIREARSLFMNVDTLSSLSKYMARLSLVLSKTMNVEVDFSNLNIETIEDILCRDDDNGNAVEDKDGKLRIHTDGTGYISDDLALQCQKIVPKDINATNLEPLLIQFRLFNNGSAVKGTFLVNKKLCPRTMQIRPSMIKVEPTTSNASCINSLEIVGTSNRPKRTSLSRNLIALLNYGGVPKEFFLDILKNALEDAQGALTNKRAALRVAANYGEMDDFSVANMILSGIPMEEPYLQLRLHVLMKKEKKSLKGGKLPVPESYYLMGTTDPTGLLKSDEVCIILDNGQISGKVLVYRNPGLHFGDIHVLKATYVKALEDFVGNAKYAIFFPCKGPRSLADEIAGGDFDGDMYFVSRNPTLLEYFKPSEPWVSSSITCQVPSKKASEYLDDELEDELFKLFLKTRFQPSYTVGVAADSWLALMDRLITLGDDRSGEKVVMKEKMCRLIDIYYDALDAPKRGGGKIELPDELIADMFPHYLERKEENSFKSTSVLGLIYDKVKSYGEEQETSNDVWKLPGFVAEVSEACRLKWEEHYTRYRQDMTAALNNTKEIESESADDVIKRYKEILYEAPEFEKSKRSETDIFEDALAIYEVCYDYAKSRGEVSKCGFAWKVAGQALCKYYISSQSEQSITCSPSVLKEIFG